MSEESDRTSVNSVTEGEQLYFTPYKTNAENKAAIAWHELLLTRDEEHLWTKSEWTILINLRNNLCFDNLKRQSVSN